MFFLVVNLLRKKNKNVFFFFLQFIFLHFSYLKLYIFFLYVTCFLHIFSRFIKQKHEKKPETKIFLNWRLSQCTYSSNRNAVQACQDINLITSCRDLCKQQKWGLNVSDPSLCLFEMPTQSLAYFVCNQMQIIMKSINCHRIHKAILHKSLKVAFYINCSLCYPLSH